MMIISLINAHIYLLDKESGNLVLCYRVSIGECYEQAPIFHRSAVVIWRPLLSIRIQFCLNLYCICFSHVIISDGCRLNNTITSPTRQILQRATVTTITWRRSFSKMPTPVWCIHRILLGKVKGGGGETVILWVF